MAVVSSEINDPIMKLYSIYNDKGQSVKMEEKGIFFCFSICTSLALISVAPISWHWWTGSPQRRFQVILLFFLFFFSPRTLPWDRSPACEFKKRQREISKRLWSCWLQSEPAALKRRWLTATLGTSFLTGKCVNIIISRATLGTGVKWGDCVRRFKR